MVVSTPFTWATGSKTERYKVVHKLGAGGFSTVWLARGNIENQWVAMKIVDARHSTSADQWYTLSRQAEAYLQVAGWRTAQFVEAGYLRQFAFDGPNGHHTCLVLPVLGPSMAELSYLFNSRLTPQIARKVAYEATTAVADLHSQGLCHGDITTGNLLFCLSDIQHVREEDIYQVLGPPVTGALETESGEPTGPEAPEYIVRRVDFLSTPTNLIKPEVRLIDFDQCFLASSPPKKMLGTPYECLAPEVAAGLPSSPMSDVWALGCCILQLRSGAGPFSSPYDVYCPHDQLCLILHTLREALPSEWQGNLWDSQGQPTKDSTKGDPLIPWGDDHDQRSCLRDMVFSIYDKPVDLNIETGRPRKTGQQQHNSSDEMYQPFSSSFSNIAWNPSSITVDGVYMSGFNDEWDKLKWALPKIPEDEASLLYDLMSKIFVLDPEKRPTAREILSHPWFHLDRQ